MKNGLYILTLLMFILVTSCKKEQTLDIPLSTFEPTYVDAMMPPFFPPMDVPADNPLTEEGIQLGRYLFWDTILSGDNTQSCATCHKPENAFSDPQQFSTGIAGEQGNRQAMAIVNLGWGQGFFWDARATALEDQVVGPVANPIEMNQDWDELLVELAGTDLYPGLFKAAYGSEEITKDKCAKALASFLRTLVSYQSKFDRQKIGQYVFTDSELRGWNLFQVEGPPENNPNAENTGGDCFHCHPLAGMGLTDFLLHNNGLDTAFEDPGLGAISGDDADLGKFRTPTLRNIEFSAPYMHDGRFNTLEEVIDHYNSGGKTSPTVDPLMLYSANGLQFSEQDKADLIAFLKCLSDTAFINNPAFSDPHE